MDPPYLGTSIGRDKRYHRQLRREDLIVGLEDFRRRSVPFALSYDGMTGGREYGPPLPESLGLTRLLLHAGTSSQSTLSGRNEETVESLYLTPGLAESADEAASAPIPESAATTATGYPTAVFHEGMRPDQAALG